MDSKGDEKSPDFVIAEGPNAGMTVDFMFSVDTAYAGTHMNRNFLRSPGDRLAMFNRLNDHLAKADIVPLNFRNLTLENQEHLMEIINQLPPAVRTQLLIIR
ncbi:hypothetical protein [Variovorax sp. WS11]|uniref:hypothetical protein n=1 Tax=Variovorax sp. WS11 TaxID=1105204 RepID=UPI001EF2C383|nr:hypothetical protein [Variovorax sp. WS11]